MVGEIDPGIRPQPPAVTDNREAHQFELTVDGQTSVLIYERRPNALALLHTEVPPGRYTLQPGTQGLYFPLHEPATVDPAGNITTPASLAPSATRDQRLLQLGLRFNW